ncbi:MAG TPA: RnfABCDGE type electron transport complex subunit B [Gammaproteobacteria bacterium]
MLSAAVILGGLAVALSALLVSAERLLPRRGDELTDRIERLLPRIQCAQCGYPGCRPYAAAVASGAADINLCPPGGEQTMRRLAELLGREPLPVDTSRGTASIDRVAVIDEDSCIGCNLCAQACPVDAIVGIPQALHAVIRAYCTGCELCLPPCPVDCISMVPRGA